MQNVFYVGLFGLLGVLSRYSIDVLLGDYVKPFPISTFIINFVGCFVAGVVYVMSERGLIPPTIQLGMIVGFCGGFTTFSAYALQTVRLLETGTITPAITYVLLSPAVGLLATYLPIAIAKRIP